MRALTIAAETPAGGVGAPGAGDGSARAGVVAVANALAL